MALALNDRVQETGTANTTVSFTLSGAVQGFQSFAVIGNGNTTFYSATDQSGNWEVGLGTYSTTGPTLTRTSVYASSNSGSAVTFSGTVTVFVTYPAEKSVNLDASGNVSPLGTIASGTWQGTTVAVAYGGTGVTASSGANSVVLRDADENIVVNSVTQELTKTVSSAGITTLTPASSHFQVLTGTTTQTYKLPDASTLPTGSIWIFDNDSTGNLTVTDNAGATVDVVAPGGYATVFLEANGTVGGEWGRFGMIPAEVNWGTNSLDLGGSTVVTNGTWQGNAVQPGYGGTGLTTFTAANYALYSTGASTLTAGTLPLLAGGTGATTASDARTNLGLGTIATQDANNVAITGGAIDGTTIGGTTPAAGTFTTLTATGQTSLGGVVGSEGLRVNTTASGTRYVAVSGSTGAGNPNIIASAGNLVVSGGSTAGVIFYSNSYGAQQMAVSHTASAVNYVQVTGAATGNSVSISAQGSDANVGVFLSSKGSGNLNFQVAGALRQRINGADGTVDSGISASGGIAFKATPVSNQVNYLQAAGNATGLAVQFSAQGTDTNISQVFQSKGTGAIDLAAGSSGVNISNGGTVTAITRTANGSGYTSIPTIAITAPTTAGGVQATATASLFANTATVSAGGTGYTLNDVVTLVGGTPAGSGATYTVTGVSGGVVTSVSPLNFQSYTALPSNPVSVTGGTGTGLTLTVTYGYQGATITNAGSGYVEQPTVSFSGGGGSGAAAYATVGSGSVIRALGATGTQSLDFYTPASIITGVPTFRIRDNSTADSYPMTYGLAQTAVLVAQGNTNAVMSIGSNGNQYVRFTTNGTSLTEQMRVSHTASAVNYVQVTGGTTGGQPYITAQGSDTTVGLSIASKGTSFIYLRNAGTTVQFSAGGTSTAVNYLNARGNAAGTGPALEAVGTDTNIDLTLTPKGTGVVKTSGTGLQLPGSSSGYVGLKGAAAAGSTTYTLPAADGTSGQVLSTNGSGTLSWASAAGGSPGGSTTQVQYNSAGSFAGSANLTFDGTNLTCGGTVTANSDETLKTNWRELPADFIEQLAKVKHGTYDRLDLELTQDGVSAQSLQPLLPNSVLKGEDGKLSVAYGNAALVAAIELAERVVQLEARLAALEK